MWSANLTIDCRHIMVLGQKELPEARRTLPSYLPESRRWNERGRFSKRRILCVFPRYTPSFGTFEYSYPLTDGARAFMPPQGLLVIAAYLPADWEIRFVDENMTVGDRRRFRVGGGRIRQRHAHPAAADERHLPQGACLRSAGCARRAVGQRVPGLLSVIRLSARRRTRRRHRSADRRGSRATSRGRTARSSSRPKIASRCRSFRSRPTSWPRSRATSSAACSIRAAARISANSATFRGFTGAIRG